MSQLVTIQDTQLEQLLYHDIPVVTFQQIADVHGISVQNVFSSFRRHKERFTEGKHFYLVENAVEYLGHNGTLKTIYLFTEKGYLLLTKPLRDAKAWEVQERMVDDYFALKQVQAATFPQPPPPPLLPSPKEQLALAREAALLLEDFGTITQRDKLMLSDVVRNAVFAGDQRLLGHGADSRYGFSLAERVKALGYQLSRKAEASIFPTLGKRIAAEYRRRYKTHKVPKETRYVDGAQRPVAWYGSEDATWIDPMIQGYLAQLPGIGAV